MVCAALLLCCACKKENREVKQLVDLVEQINSQPDITLANGNTLTKCEYQNGDSIFTYYIKVNDNRYDNAITDSIKESVGEELKEDEMKKIISTLCKNHLGLKYVFNTTTGNIEIVFSAEELSQQ